MSFIFQNAVNTAVENVANDGSVLDINANALKIMGPRLSADIATYDRVALALIKAASRRNVAMTFCNPHA